MTILVNPSPTLDLADSIRQLHRRLDFDLTYRFLPDARDCEAVCRYLARKVKSPAIVALAKRARTTVRLLEVSRHV